MAKFMIAPSAETDLNEIWEYIAGNNESAAETLIRELIRKFELLAANKEIDTRQDDFIVEMRMFSFKNYRIYYFASDDGVEIYRVLHGKHDIESIFD